MNRGSFDNLNVLTRCGCSANARQIRLIAVWLKPHRLAIARVLHWVASRGVDSSVRRTTRSTSVSRILRGAPGRGSSSKPDRRFCTKRPRHRPTVWRVTPAARAMASFVCSVAHASTMRARWARACAVLGRRAHCSSVSRSSRSGSQGGWGDQCASASSVFTRRTPALATLFHDFQLRTLARYRLDQDRLVS